MKYAPAAAIAGIVLALGVVGTPLASAARPRLESTAQFLKRADAICQTATRDVTKATNISGNDSNPNLILKSLAATGRAYAWESRAFHALTAPRWASNEGYDHLTAFYSYAGQQMSLSVQEDQLGDDDEGTLDLTYAQTDVQDAANETVELGISGCTSE